MVALSIVVFLQGVIFIALVRIVHLETMVVVMKAAYISTFLGSEAEYSVDHEIG